ncbi:MAG: SUMF1/EgtB/PvdO family nonheme iron enzyme [Verrucomicrobia bacterium]|nr:SUMF1/EgtB/PvdO family nonheme iron enzyme [Verrucomicrobiota bacterium]
MLFLVRAQNTPPPGPTGFALIPAGELMGGVVYVSAFLMEKYLVTKAQWDDVRTWGLTHGYSDLSAGAGKASNHPVQNITWYDTVKWCNARSEREGLTPCYRLSGEVYRTTFMQHLDSAVEFYWAASGYRLPTEMEWEKAARGSLSGKRFPWGDTISHSQANYYVNTDNGTTNNESYDVSPTRGFHPTYATGAEPYTSPVGSFAPNGCGLYEMAGNVYEWCWDWYDWYNPDWWQQFNPLGPPSGAREIRGENIFKQEPHLAGSWVFGWQPCRCGGRSCSYLIIECWKLNVEC